MTLEDPQNLAKKNKPQLKVVRGGQFDETSFLKRAEKILPKIQNTDDKRWLFSVFNSYRDLLDDENLKPAEREIVDGVIYESSMRLSDLGFAVTDQEEDREKIRKTEKYEI